MSDLDKTALVKALQAHRKAADQTDVLQVEGAIQAYLATRREQESRVETNPWPTIAAVDEWLAPLVAVCGDRIVDADLYEVRPAISAAITAAIEEEREQCAMVAEGPNGSMSHDTRVIIAAAIRSRSSQGAQGEK